jgi:thiamine biosynthesis protein ThiS
MKVVFKLFASLTPYLRTQAPNDNIVELEVAPQTTIAQLVERFQLPDHLVHLVLVNGTFIAPEKRAGHSLQEGDTLAIWPPIAGG